MTSLEILVTYIVILFLMCGKWTTWEMIFQRIQLKKQYDIKSTILANKSHFGC